MRRIALSLLALFWLTLAPVPLSAFAQDFPQLTGRVVDTADLIDPAAERDLAARLKAHEDATGEQLVVVTIPTLGGEPLERYTLDLARAWGIGTAERNDGALFLIARDDRKMRIEVGYGLEGRLTDAATSLILRLDVAPLFRKGDFSGGILRGAERMLTLLESSPEERRAWEQSRDRGNEIDWFGVGFFALIALIFFSSFGMALLARLFGRKIKPGHYRWLGMDFHYGRSGRRRRSGHAGGWSGGGGWSGSGGGGFSGGGGSFGGGGSSGSW